ncbi:hypothetical protein DFH08DRAFT_819470 [Mycena albidolilacea]|uniref:Uncharacterized protein n=1 Tax=Mycena albidolilacea TaxID=1033008 RepID=A0AAD6ZE68_9AGAR|nr:hypothetical protein DFH08DRAFT_819470 [Mycena albidolilacea]
MFSPSATLRKSTTGTLLLLLFVASAIPHVLAASVNRTIDDTFGDPATGALPTLGPTGWFDDFCEVFLPLAVDCPTGHWAPDKKDAFNQTYHFTYSAADFLTLQFTGTAIYVYTLVINSTQHHLGLEGAFGGAGFTAQLDGGPAKVQHGDLNGLPALPAYNVLLYSKTGLENTTHSLTIRPLKGQLLFFDFAVYTFEEPDLTPSASSSALIPIGPTLAASASSLSAPTGVSSSSDPGPGVLAASKQAKLAGPIAGGILGGLALLGALGFLLFLVARRRRRREAAAESAWMDDAGNNNLKRRSNWPPDPIPRNMTPTAGFIYEGWAPESWSDAAASPRMSFISRGFSHARASSHPSATGPEVEFTAQLEPQTESAEMELRELTALEEKNALYLVGQEEAGREVARLEQQIRELTEAARPSLPSEAMDRWSPDRRTNSQLVMQIRTLRERIAAIQNDEMQLPEYTIAF